MPDLAVATLMDNVERLGSELGDKATRLSEIIAEIEARLMRMGGKVAVSVVHERTQLSFDRIEPTGWAVWLGSEGSRERLTNASIYKKGAAFPVLLMLLARLEESQREQLKLVEKSLGEFSRSSAAALLDKKEGK